MIVADASVLIALLDPLDPYHRAAVQVLGEARAGTVLTHPITLAEVLVGPTRRGAAATVLAGLRRILRVVEVDDDAPLRLASWREAARLRMPDCCVLDAAARSGAAIATFDVRLQREAERLGVPVLS